MRFVIIGCGFVSTFYGDTIPNHSQLDLVGVLDIVPEYGRRFAEHYGVKQYHTLNEVLSDSSVEAVINLTNPRFHFEISRAALLAGKHVYSEKPLAIDFDDAIELVAIAKERGLQLSCAPCNVLSESAQTVWKAIEEGLVGPVRLVYAEMDDGLIHQLGCENWQNSLGRPWPYRDEFEVGCTLEHAAYYVTWLVAFFGSVKRVQSFASVLIPDKQMGEPVPEMAPDYSVATLEFASGVVARLTCSVIAPHDHRLRVFGDQGTVSIEDCWFNRSPVHFEPFSQLSIRKRKIPFFARLKNAHVRKLPLVRSATPKHRYRTRGHRMDFAGGIAEMADAISEGRENRLGAELSLHINEIVLKIQSPSEIEPIQTMTTSAPTMQPMPWAGFTVDRQPTAEQRPGKQRPSEQRPGEQPLSEPQPGELRRPSDFQPPDRLDESESLDQAVS